METTLDLAAHYELSPDLLVIQRDPSTVQIGTDDPRQVMIVDAPGGTREFLLDLAHLDSLGEAFEQLGPHQDRWRAIAQQLLRMGLLLEEPGPRSLRPELAGEHLTLTHQHGFAAAGRLMTARSDAVVIVDGDTAMADIVTELLCTLGIGHVHHRSADLDSDGRPPDRRAKIRPARTDMSWQTPLDVRVHRPASQVKPTAVVLADSGPPDPGRAAELVSLVVPHLPIQLNPARCVVGPFVLPGRTPCLNCLERHRADADQHWPAVVGCLRAHPLPASARLAYAGAVVAAEQIVEFIDGIRRPESIGTSIEILPTATRTGRQIWSEHPQCLCRNLPGR